MVLDQVLPCFLGGEVLAGQWTVVGNDPQEIALRAQGAVLSSTVAEVHLRLLRQGVQPAVHPSGPAPIMSGDGLPGVRRTAYSHHVFLVNAGADDVVRGGLKVAYAGVDLRETEAVGSGDSLGAGSDAEFAVDPGQVGGNGTGTNEQRLGDLGVGMACG
jgi:hypothetical protein